MNLIDIYNLMQSKQISLDEAATALNMTPKNLKIRMTKWGHRFPLMLSVLDKIAADQITRAEACETLEVGPRAVNKLAESWKVERPIKEYLVTRAASQVKWEIRKKFAIDFIAGSTTVEEAAEAAEVSSRQMRRWVSELLMKHFEMPWKDLQLVSLSKRKQLADEIEIAEGIEIAKQNVVNAIARGERTLEEEALQRVAEKHGRKTVNV